MRVEIGWLEWKSYTDFCLWSSLLEKQTPHLLQNGNLANLFKKTTVSFIHGTASGHNLPRRPQLLGLLDQLNRNPYQAKTELHPCTVLCDPPNTASQSSSFPSYPPGTCFLIKPCVPITGVTVLPSAEISLTTAAHRLSRIMWLTKIFTADKRLKKKLSPLLMKYCKSSKQRAYKSLSDDKTPTHYIPTKRQHLRKMLNRSLLRAGYLPRFVSSSKYRKVGFSRSVTHLVYPHWLPLDKWHIDLRNMLRWRVKAICHPGCYNVKLKGVWHREEEVRGETSVVCQWLALR